MKRIIKFLRIISITIFAWFIIHSIYIISGGLSDNGAKADVAVILGNKVNEDGTLSERLEKRLETAVELYRNHRIKKLIVSGGLGKEGFYEGSKMKEYLISKTFQIL